MILWSMSMGKQNEKAMLPTHTTTHTITDRIRGELVEVKFPLSSVNAESAGDVMLKAVKSG